MMKPNTIQTFACPTRPKKKEGSASVVGKAAVTVFGAHLMNFGKICKIFKKIE